MPKTRLDQVLVESGFFKTRSQAARAIKLGYIKVGGSVCTKTGEHVPSSARVEVLPLPCGGFVSWGGVKLEHALRTFNVDVSGRVCFDIGASTGGFTHCLLMRGARHVFAVDAGREQLNEQLKNDPRVHSLEGTNARALVPDSFTPAPDFAAIDVSFISLLKVLEPLKNFTSIIETVCLIKPQHEAPRELIVKGVVRKKQAHIIVLEKIWQQCPPLGFIPVAFTFSPIQGPKGNIEYFCHLTSSRLTSDTYRAVFNREDLPLLVEEAHDKFS